MPIKRHIEDLMFGTIDQTSEVKYAQIDSPRQT